MGAKEEAHTVAVDLSAVVGGDDAGEVGATEGLVHRLVQFPPNTTSDAGAVDLPCAGRDELADATLGGTGRPEVFLVNRIEIEKML